MPEDPELLQFFNDIESDVTAEVQPDTGNPADFRELAFTRILSDELEAAGILEAPVVCHCELGRTNAPAKASGYGVPEEDSRLDLFITVYKISSHAEVPTLNATEIDSSFNKLERYLSLAFNGLHQDLDPAVPQSYMAERIHQHRAQFDRVNFFLFTNSRLSVRREKERKPQVGGLPATYEVWDIERFRRLRESGASYEALNVDLRSQPLGGLPCVRLDADENGFRACIAIFPGSLLRDLYDEHGSRLLELNVRSYLQAKGKINKQILETLRKNPADFMAFNNGITVVAEKLSVGTLKDGHEGILELQGMQIVNGGQTTASIHRAAKDFEADLSKFLCRVRSSLLTLHASMKWFRRSHATRTARIKLRILTYRLTTDSTLDWRGSQSGSGHPIRRASGFMSALVVRTKRLEPGKATPTPAVAISTRDIRPVNDLPRRIWQSLKTAGEGCPTS